MALTATLAPTLAAAFAAVCTAGAIGLSPGLFAVLLLPSVGLSVARPDRKLPRIPGDRRWAIGLASMAALLLYTLARSPGHYRFVLAAVIPVSLLWPAPAALRLSLLVCALSLPGAAPSLSEAGPWLVGMAAGAAVTLVTLNRTGTPGRRVANRAAALFAIATLVALIVASTLKPPSPPSPSGGDPEATEARPRPSAPYLDPLGRLDGGGPGTGDGKEVVLRVSAPVGTLWRTMTFDRYDGRIWTRSAATQPYSQFQTVFVPAGPGDGSSHVGRPMEQHVRVETELIAVLAAAARLVTAELPERTRAVVSSEGTVYTAPGLRRGASYTARSALVPTSAEALRPHDASSGVPEEVAQLYLGSTQSEHVDALLRDITGGGSTQYDKVKAIERWLAANTGVARDAPAAAPGVDPVDQFLFTDRRGSSVQAATAMAVMVRSLRIPARLAVGYLPGDRSLLGDEFVVRARHAHAWVEVWFPTVGWAAFDPSGQFEGPQSRTESLLERLKRLWWVLLVVAAVLIAALVIWAVRRSRRRRARPWATRCYERLGKAGHRRGRPRQPQETPAEYCATLAADVPDERLLTVGQLVTAAAWSTREPPEEAREWADDVVAAIPRRRSRRAPPG